MSYDVRKIANAILDQADHYGYPITNMALNKLVFFAHGWHLALYDRPLVSSSFEAWQFGPVHPQIYRQFKSYDDHPIRGRAHRINLSSGNTSKMEYDLPELVTLHIGNIIEFYGSYSASRLSQISHEVGAPWDQVWNGTGSRPGMTIDDNNTKNYYKSKLKGNS